jgi:hypothetical protein
VFQAVKRGLNPLQVTYYRSARLETNNFVTYSAPVEIQELISSFCVGWTIALSPNGRWLGIADGESANSEVHILDLTLPNTSCSDTTRVWLGENEGPSVLRFNANSTRLWVGQPYATFANYGDGPTQGFTAEFGLGFNGQWSETQSPKGYLFGGPPNFNAGYGAALAFSSDTSVRAVLAEANQPTPTGYDRNPDIPTLLLQRTGAEDSLFSYSDPAPASRVGKGLSMDSLGSTVVHAATTDTTGGINPEVNLHTFYWAGNGWQRRDQTDINVFDCFGDLPNIASSYDEPSASDTVISADGQRLALTIHSQGRESRFAFGLCIFSREGNGDWELLVQDSQTATNALRSAVGRLFSSASSPALGKLQATESLGRIFIPHKDFAAVIELKWSEMVDQTGLPIWLLYEASKS